jgi:hypothetical protein
MMPGGHLATASGLGIGSYAITGSAELAVGCFAGGFLIDVDHYLDYLVFERQWRRPGPASFLRYYFRSMPRWLVLPLHSLELMAILTAVAVGIRSALLAGYLLGAAMHIGLDILINGDYALRQPILFYFFSYRAAQGFAAIKLLDVSVTPGAGEHPFRDFFKWRPLTERKKPEVMISKDIR